jgi:hypothetical protein
MQMYLSQAHLTAAVAPVPHAPVARLLAANIASKHHGTPTPVSNATQAEAARAVVTVLHSAVAPNPAAPARAQQPIGQ